MPLKDIVKKFVVFVLGWRKPVDGGPEQLTPIGTAFFVAVPAIVIPDSHFTYLITAKHVVQGERETFIRAIQKDGTPISVRVPEWTPHPTEDVATVDAGGLDALLDYAKVLVPDFFLDHRPELVASLGDRVYFVGLFADVPGLVEGNIPMVRSGTIGALNVERVPIRLADESTSFITAHLVDCHSFAGFSGSPCFAQFYDKQGEATPLLGLMSGHFDKWSKARGTGDFSADYVGDIHAPVNSGVGLCTPVEKITETLNLEELMESRERGEAKEKERRERDQVATADKGSEPDQEGGEFGRFEDLTQKLVGVPKPEIDKKRKSES